MLNKIKNNIKFYIRMQFLNIEKGNFWKVNISKIVR